jgi:MFS family permease
MRGRARLTGEDRPQVTDQPPSSGAWRIFRSRNFGPYFVGNAASASGTWFQNLAAAILIYRLTQSALWLGVLNACQFGPVLLLSPWTGRVADAFDRRLLLIGTQSTAACSSAVLAALVWTNHAGAWVVIAFSGCLGVLTALSNPTQMALVGSLVPRADLPQAVALNSMTFNLARALGPVAAAGVIAGFGVAPAFAINALSYLLLVAALLSVSPTPVARVRRGKLRESVAIVRRQPRLLVYLGIVMAVSVAADPVNAESPTVIHAFGYPSVWAGAIVGCFGAGAVAAALRVSSRTASSRRHIGVMLALLAGGIMSMAASPWLPLAFVFLFASGFGSLAANAAATARLQLSVADAERGRVMALWSICWMGTRPLTSLFDGALANWQGIRVAAPVMAAPALVGAIVILLGTRAIRASGRSLDTPPPQPADVA